MTVAAFEPPPVRDTNQPKRQTAGGRDEPDAALHFIPTPF
jgi:hypothetical protein